MNDAEIVKQVREGDREAYSQLVSRYQNAVYGVAYHYLRSFEDARDVAQETFVHAYLCLEQLREADKFGAWVRQIAVNRCHIWQRQRQATEPMQDVFSTASEVRQIETRMVVQQALECLSEASRLTLTLYYFQAFSIQEIASFLEVPVTTVKSRLRNARARLHKELMQMVEETLKQEALPADFAVRVMHSISGSGAVYSIAFSPDGKLLATDSSRQADPDKSRDEDQRLIGEVQLWDVQSGQLLHTLRTSHANLVWSVTFSPDGKLLACGSIQPGKDEVLWDGEVQLWDVESGTLQRTLEVPDAIVRAVTFSPDGQTIASGSTRSQAEPYALMGEVQLWDVQAGALQKRLPLGSGQVWALCFSPDSQTIASGSGRTGDKIEGRSHRDWIEADMRLWDVASGEVRQTWVRPRANAQSKISFSPDGQTVVTGDGPEGDILLWDTATGVPRHALHGHANRVFAVAFSPDGRLLASGSQDKTVKLWDVATGECLRTMSEHPTAVHAVAFSSDGQTLASADIDRVVKIWTVK